MEFVFINNSILNSIICICESFFSLLNLKSNQVHKMLTGEKMSCVKVQVSSHILLQDSLKFEQKKMKAPFTFSV